MPMLCLARETVTQRVELGRVRQFEKEIFRIGADEPVVVVRKRRVAREPLAPVVLVHGFGQNRYAWHLPERSFANYLAEQGFDVFNVDLRGHGRSAELGGRRGHGVDEYIRGDVPAVIDAVEQLTGFKRTFLMGHSLGGICVAAAAARAPDRVAGVVTIGSPHALGRGHLVLGIALRAAGHTLGRTGVMCRSGARFPVDLIGRGVHATRMAWNAARLPIPVRVWKPGTLSNQELRSYMRAFDCASFGTIHDLIELGATGVLRSRADGSSYTELIERSELPLLTVCGTADLLANPRSVKPMYERSRSRDKRYVKVDAGHADLLIGRQAPVLVWPTVRDWLDARVRLARGALTHRAVSTR
ncbi:MAG: alpha/beta fold hydrolase [Polyangiaceae bacterium]|nr:alpha/beta fold hydrolase [Polyangiaceae bacterium]